MHNDINKAIMPAPIEMAMEIMGFLLFFVWTVCFFGIFVDFGIKILRI